ncbi:MAG: type II secretion system F family protein [Desulfobacteraceae bacterium]|jgi:tight adherence protein B
MPLFIAMLAGLVILFFGISTYYLLKDRAALEKEKRLKELNAEGSEDGRMEGSVRKEQTRSLVERLLGRFLDLAALESLLISADVPLSLERLLTLSLGMGVLFVIPILVILKNALAVLVALAAGIALPFAYVVYRKRKREEALVEQLPDTLDMIVRALKVGQSVDGALQEVARSFPPPIGTEIKTVYDEMAVGLPFEAAFRNFEKRFPRLPDVKILVTSFIIQRETGGNLTAVLEGVAHTVRERFQLKRQVRVLTAEGRSSAIVLGLLPAAFLIVAWIFNPKYIGLLFHDPLGRKLLLAAVLLEAAGFMIMRYMSRINV